jgi:hypothetical protein
MYRGFYSRCKFIALQKSQHTTVKHSEQLFEHMYTSNLYGIRTLTPIEFFQHDLLQANDNHHYKSFNIWNSFISHNVGDVVHLHC